MKKSYTLLLCIIMMLSITIVSSAEWDNCKEVSEEGKEVKIKDKCLFGLDVPLVTNEIATITLDTPLNNYVTVGYQKVAQITVYSKKDYGNALALIDFYNKEEAKKNKEDFIDYEVNLNFDYKYLNGYKEIEQPTYNRTCVMKVDPVEGEYKHCDLIQNGTKIILEQEWLPLLSLDFVKDKNVTIGIFTEVNINDNYEWIPTIAGERIDEWAEWTQSLNIGLVQYFKFDNVTTDGTTSIDSTGWKNGTISGAVTGVVGKIGEAYMFDGSNDYVNTTDTVSKFTGITNATINLWLKTDYADTDANGGIFYMGNYDLFGSRYRISDNNNYFGTFISSRTAVWGKSAFAPNNWHMITVTHTPGANGWKFYVNASLENQVSGNATVSMDVYSFIGCAMKTSDLGTCSKGMDGLIDEVGIWNRTLNATEVTQLYNNTFGITFEDFGPSPSPTSTVTLITPESFNESSNTTTKSYNISCNASNDGGIINLSRVINGSIFDTVTNSTPGQNLTIEGNVTFPSGVHNWTCTAFSLFDAVTPGVRFINYTYRNIVIDLLSPEDNFATNLTSLNFTANVTNISLGIDNISIVWDDVVNQTNTSVGVSGNYTFQISNIGEGNHEWYFQAYGNDSIFYRSPTTRTFILSAINLTLINPEDAYNSTNTTVNFNCSSKSVNEGILNLTLNIDGVSNLTVTNSSPSENLSVDVLRTLNEGAHNWSCETFSQTSFLQSDTRTMTLDNTLPFINITAPLTTQGVLNDNDTMRLNWTITEDNLEICYYTYNTTVGNDSVSLLTNTYFTFSTNNATNIAPGDIAIITQFPAGTREVFDDSPQSTALGWTTPSVSRPDCSTETYITNQRALTGNDGEYMCFQLKDGTKITAQISNPGGVGGEVYLNWTMPEKNFVTCSDNTTTFQYVNGQNSITMFANDTLSNFNFSTRSWTVNANIVDQGFKNPVVEGSNNLYYLTVNVTAPLTITDVDLIYNGSFSEATFIVSGEQYNITESILAPGVDSETNFTFFWQITYNDSSQFNTSSTNQTVTLLAVDDCSVNNFVLINFSLFDEESQQFINGTFYNTTVEVELSLFGEGTNDRVLHFFQNYTEDNNPKVCLAEDLGNATFDMILLVQYRGDGYATEEYNIIGGKITNDSITTNITLFDLLSEDSTEFLITYKDESFTAIDDALIQIQRKYVSEGVFKTVEIPKTDQFGQTKGHFDTDKGIYTFVVVKDGEIIALFNETTVVCQDVLLGNCDLNLNELVSDAQFSDWDNFGGVSVLQSFDESTRTVTTQFSSTSGSVVTMNITTIKFDRFENTTVCTDTLLSASGTLSCTVPDSFGNITIISKTMVNGELVETQSYSITPDATDFFGISSYVFLLILLLTIPFMMASSTIGVVFGAIMGFIMAGMLMVYKSSSTFGTISSIVWLIISGGIIIWKIAQRE